MKKDVFSLALVVLPLILFSGFGKKKESPVCSVTNSRNNFVYLCLANPIEIRASGIDSSDLLVTVDTGVLTGSNGHYILYPAQKPYVIIRVANGKSGKEIFTKKFRIRKIPDPVCYFANKKLVGEISKRDFIMQLGIFSRMESFDYNMTYHVRSFEMTTLVDGKYVTEKAVGPSFTPEMKKLMERARNFDRYFIENVMVVGPDSLERKINGVTLIVRE
jgi:hypothetical protein